MADDISTRLFPMTIGLCWLIEDFQLQVTQPATRSEIVAGARKTIAADGKILEQYPKNYAAKGERKIPGVRPRCGLPHLLLDGTLGTIFGMYSPTPH